MLVQVCPVVTTMLLCRNPAWVIELNQMRHKTEYHDEIILLLKEMYLPSSPENEGVPMTLQDLHGEITNILPPKWVEESDVWAALKELGYKPIFQKSSNF